MTSNVTSTERGTFITVEGVHGAGKTTLIARLSDRLRSLSVPVASVIDLRATDVGRQLRAIILSRSAEALPPITEALLIAAARHQSAREVIMPHLAKGQVVISERHNDAFFAFQGYGRGLPHPFLTTVAEAAADGLRPDLTILLDVDPKRALQRIPEADKHRIEHEPIAFHERVRAGYLAMAQRYPARVRVIDATLSEEVVEAQSWVLVSALLRLGVGTDS